MTFGACALKKACPHTSTGNISSVLIVRSKVVARRASLTAEWCFSCAAKRGVRLLTIPIFAFETIITKGITMPIAAKAFGPIAPTNAVSAALTMVTAINPHVVGRAIRVNSLTIESVEGLSSAGCIITRT